MKDDFLLQKLSRYLADLPPGTRVPSARELALQFDVGRMRMHLVVKQLIGAGLLRKEGYRLSVGKPETATAGTICFFSSESAHLPAAQNSARQCGVDLRVVCDPEPGPRRKALLDLKHNHAAGILSWYHHNLDLLAELDRQGVPVVVCGHAWTGHSFVSGDSTSLFEIAIGHLAKLGHRKLSFWRWDARNLPRYNMLDMDRAYRRTCLAAKLGASARKIQVLEAQRDLAQAWKAFRVAEKPATAILCMDHRIAQTVLANAQRDKIDVPGQLSILSLREKPEAARSDPPVSTLDMNDAMIIQIGMDLLLQEMQRRKLKLGQGHFRQGIRCDPTLTLRQSTGPAPDQAPKQVSSSSPARLGSNPRESSKWPNDEVQRRALAEEINARSFPDIDSARCRPLDLSSHVNRALTPRSAWFGDQPLRNFQQGKHVIHGIPFDVARGRDPRHAAIMLRSRKARSSADTSLPLEVTLPLQGRSRSLFFLHAAAWTLRHEPIACYEFRWKGGRMERLNVLPYALGPSEESLEATWREDAIVQDWHPSFPRFESSRVLPWLVMENGDPLLYERTLYVFRWMNPQPEIPLVSLTMRSLAPQARATLAVLALTREIAAGRGAGRGAGL